MDSGLAGISFACIRADTSLSCSMMPGSPSLPQGCSAALLTFSAKKYLSGLETVASMFTPLSIGLIVVVLILVGALAGMGVKFLKSRKEKTRPMSFQTFDTEMHNIPDM